MSIDIINDIFRVCIIPLLGVLTAYFVKWVQAKTKEIDSKVDNDLADKYLNMLGETIISCVTATNQTYVNSLKDKNAFDTEAQKMAFEKTKQAVLEILSEDAKEYLNSAIGDLNAYIETQIEQQVYINKLWNTK